MSQYALAVIERMSLCDWAPKLVLGRGLALAHYMEYRTTNDADCWWEEGTSPEEKAIILSDLRTIMEEAARQHFRDAHLSTRSWGETVSIEVKAGNKKVFSWQISSRTKKLEAYIRSPYGQIKIETLQDNLASKMCALVSRGAPRDFLDIYTAIRRGLTTWEDCWCLWVAKNPGQEREKAALSIAMSLVGIETRRPLSSLPEEHQAAAAELRTFFHEHLPCMKEPGQP